MPKRSNEYQRLVLLINQHLADTNSKVSESKMLWDPKSKQDREIDIYIEQQAGPYNVSIGIECTKLSRKVGTPTLEKIITKHRNVGIDRTIVVSPSGFAETAKNYAKFEKIELLSFDQAMKKPWPAYLDQVNHILKMTLKNTIHEIQNMGFRFITKDDSKIQITPNENLKLFIDDKWITADDFIEHKFKNFSLDFFPKTFELSEKSEKNEVLRESWEFIPPLRAEDEKNNEAFCSQLSIDYIAIREDQPINFEYDTYSEKDVLYAKTTPSDEFRRSAAVVISPSDKVKKSDLLDFDVSIKLSKDKSE